MKSLVHHECRSDTLSQDECRTRNLLQSSDPDVKVKMIWCLFRKGGSLSWQNLCNFSCDEKSKLHDAVSSCYEIHATSRENGFLSNTFIVCQ